MTFLHIGIFSGVELIFHEVQLATVILQPKFRLFFTKFLRPQSQMISDCKNFGYKKEATKWENNDIATKILSLKLSAACFCLIWLCFLGTNTVHSRNGKHPSFVGNDGFSIDIVYCKNNLFCTYTIQLSFQQQPLLTLHDGWLLF